MPTNYMGVSGNVTTPLAASVAGVTYLGNGTIVVQTSAPHFFATGDWVSISGVSGATEVNNIPGNPWQITVTDATHFTLNGSYGTSTYTFGGTIEDWGLLPYFQQPSDGDPATAASILASVDALADRSVALNLLLGRNGYECVFEDQLEVSDDTFAQYATFTATGSGWNLFPSGVPVLPNASVGIGAGDIVEVIFTSTVGTFSASGSALGLNITVAAGQGSFAPIIGSAQTWPASFGPAGFNLYGKYVYPSSNSTAASITTVSGSLVTITGLHGIDTTIVGARVKVTGAASAANNGTFYVATRISSTSIQIMNPSGVGSDANNGSITVSFVAGVSVTNIQPIVDGFVNTGQTSLYGHYTLGMRISRPRQHLLTQPWFAS